MCKCVAYLFFIFFYSFHSCRPTVSSRLLPVINADRKRATHKKKTQKVHDKAIKEIDAKVKAKQTELLDD